jgi:hypothetical protein
MSIIYQITQDANGVRTLTFVGNDGQMRSINSGVANFRDTLDAVNADDIDLATEVSLPLNAVLSRLADSGFGHDGTSVTWNGRILSHKDTDILLSFARKSRERLPALGKFFDRLSNNPSKHSVDQLFDWIEDVGLSIDDEGYILGHKGIRNGLSVHSGTAIVNGVTHTGQIPNPVGATVEMSRNAVADAPQDTCSHGLHVGSLRYASSWAPTLVTVRIDPADVVSVPNDGEKMRVSKYVVLSVNESKSEFSERVTSEDWLDYDEDDDCDCRYCH